jgi:hypothetical protein
MCLGFDLHAIANHGVCIDSVCVRTNSSAMALASSPTAAPPPLTWARPLPSSPTQLPSASAAPSSPASTALLPLAPERHQLMHAPSPSNLAAPSVSASLNSTTAGLGVGCNLGLSALAAQLASALASAAPSPLASASATPLSTTATAALSSLAAPLASALASAALSPLASRHQLCPCRPQTATSSAALSSASACSARAPAHAAPLESALAVRWLRRWIPPWHDGISCAIALGISSIDYALRIAAPSSAFASAAPSSPLADSA